MASINVRISDDLKARAYGELKKLGVTPSEFMRQTLEYVAEHGELPFTMNGRDEALFEVVRERISTPRRVRSRSLICRP